MRLWRARPPEPPDTRAQVAAAPSLPIGGAGGVELLWQMIAAGASGSTTGSVWQLPGAPISEAEVLAIPAVAASLQLISSFVVQMPLQAVDDTQTPPAPIVPTPQILRAPTGDSRATGLTLADWEDEVIRDLALWGNYVAVLGDPGWDGWPRVMFPIRPGWWSVLVEGGRVVYQIGAEQYDPAEIFHVAINRGTGELIGRGLLTGNSDLVNAAVAAERFAARYFATGTSSTRTRTSRRRKPTTSSRNFSRRSQVRASRSLRRSVRKLRCCRTMPSRRSSSRRASGTIKLSRSRSAYPPRCSESTRPGWSIET